MRLAGLADLAQGDFVKINCAVRHHGAVLKPAALLKLGLSHAAIVLDLANAVCAGMRSARSGGRFDQVRHNG